MEKTFIMVKPDGMRRKLAGEVIKRLEAKGFQLLAARVLSMSRDMASEHYKEHQGQDFYAGLIKHITSGPVLAMVWQAPDAIEVARLLVGHRNPLKAAVGTIRGDYASISAENLVHAADSPEAAAREIELFFPDVKYDSKE